MLPFARAATLLSGLSQAHAQTTLAEQCRSLRAATLHPDSRRFLATFALDPLLSYLPDENTGAAIGEAMNDPGRTSALLRTLTVTASHANEPR